MTDETKEIIGAMQEMFQVLNTKIDNVENRLTNVEQLATKTAMTLENETNKNVHLLAEGYLPLAEKVDALAEDMEIVKFNVDIVKKVVTTHSKELNRLGKAK